MRLAAQNKVNWINFALIIGIVVLFSLRAKRRTVTSKNDDPLEVTRLHGISHFDFAGSQVFPDSLVNGFIDDLHKELFGNTHSESPSAEMSTNTIDDMRFFLLKVFDTRMADYTVLFTYSEAHALKLIAESFPFLESSVFYYSRRSNDNILGLRSYAPRYEVFDDGVSDSPIPPNPCISDSPNLIMLPLVDLFDGHVMTKSELSSVFERFPGHAIVADATLYLQTHRLSLKELPFHAVTFSFEKLFGFPNIGCCLVRKCLMDKLVKTYFGGGTLVYALTGEDFAKWRLSPSERFEDGSLPFLSIASIQKGFEFMQQINSTQAFKRIESLKDLLLRELGELRHINGSPLVEIYGSGQSSIVTFNVMDNAANIVSHRDVVAKAALNGIYLTSGCHSTPGTCLSSLRADSASVSSDWKNYRDLGAIRASIGWATTNEDIKKLITFLQTHFVK